MTMNMYILHAFCNASCVIMYPDVGPYIVFSNKRYIHLLSLDGARTRTVRSSLSNAVGIDYHYRFVILQH